SDRHHVGCRSGLRRSVAAIRRAAYIRASHPREVRMTYEDIVSLLGYAGGHEQAVRIMTTDRTEVIGIPTSVDTHVTAHEVYLRPTGADDTEIAVSLAA